MGNIRIPLLILIFSFLFHGSAANHTKKQLPSVMIVGNVFCDTCSQQKFSKTSHFISGASVAVECRGAEQKPSFHTEAKTNRHGKFEVHLPFTISKHVKRIKACSVKLISSSEPFCSVASLATSTLLQIKSRKQGHHIFSAGFFTFKPTKQPELCNQKQLSTLPPLYKRAHSGSLTNLGPLPKSQTTILDKKTAHPTFFFPPIPLIPLPPNPFFPPPLFPLPPNPFFPPPLFPPNPFQPPSFFPPNPFQPPSFFPPNPFQPPPPNPFQPPPSLLPLNPFQPPPSLFPPIPFLTPPPPPLFNLPPIPFLTPPPPPPLFSFPPLPILPPNPFISPPPPPPPLFSLPPLPFLTPPSSPPPPPPLFSFPPFPHLPPNPFISPPSPPPPTPPPPPPLFSFPPWPHLPPNPFISPPSLPPPTPPPPPPPPLFLFPPLPHLPPGPVFPGIPPSSNVFPGIPSAVPSKKTSP